MIKNKHMQASIFTCHCCRYLAFFLSDAVFLEGVFVQDNSQPFYCFEKITPLRDISGKQNILFERNEGSHHAVSLAANHLYCVHTFFNFKKRI